MNNYILKLESYLEPSIFLPCINIYKLGAWGLVCFKDSIVITKKIPNSILKPNANMHIIRSLREIE